MPPKDNISRDWVRFEKYDQVVFVRNMHNERSQSVGHHHQDFGHFILYIHGRPVLVDGGRITYRNNDWGRFGCYPEAHNTILVDGFGLVPRRLKRYPVSYSEFDFSIDVCKTNESFKIVISASGFRRIGHNIEWKRQILLSEKKFEVVDELDGTGNHQFNSFFHWANELTIRGCFNKNFSVTGQGYSGIATVRTPTPVSGRLHEGKNNPLGWQVVSYGNAVPAITMELSGRVALPAQTYFCIFLE